MSKKIKIEEKLRDFNRAITWDELVTMFEGMGFQLHQSGGSHVFFRHPETQVKLRIAKPHGSQKDLKGYQRHEAIVAIDNHMSLYNEK